MHAKTGQTTKPDEPPPSRGRRRLYFVAMLQLITVALLLAGSNTGNEPDFSTLRKGMKRRQRRNPPVNPSTTDPTRDDEPKAFMHDELLPEDIDPVVRATDELIRQEALRQLDMLDFDDIDARLTPLSDLAEGLTDAVDSEPGDHAGLFGVVHESTGRRPPSDW